MGKIKTENKLSRALNDAAGIAILLVIIFVIPFWSLYWAINSGLSGLACTVAMLFLIALYVAASHLLNKRYDIAVKIESPFMESLDPKGGVGAVISCLLGGIIQNAMIIVFWFYKLWTFGA